MLSNADTELLQASNEQALYSSLTLLLHIRMNFNNSENSTQIVHISIKLKWDYMQNSYPHFVL